MPGIANALLYDFRGLNKGETTAQLARLRQTLARYIRSYRIVSVAMEWRGIKYELDDEEDLPARNWWEPFLHATSVNDPLFNGAPGWVGINELAGYGGKLRKVYIGIFVR